MNKEKTYRISSNLTLFFKIGVPVFWGIFFGSIALAFIISKEEKIIYAPLYLRIGFLLFFLFFLLIIFFTLLRLKRVEMGQSHFYVSNYFKTFRYAFEDVDRIKSIDFGIIHILSIHLKKKATFGRKLPFIVSKTRLKEYLENTESNILTSALK